ncbi:MAG: tetratricopeptide repeat protein [Thermodesulfobacteriota bacterium]
MISWYKQVNSRLLLVLVVPLMVIIVSGCGSDGSRSRAHLDNGREFFEKEDYHQAAVSYRRAAAVDPGSVEAWTGLGRACVRLGDIKGANEAYQRAIAIVPDHAEALLNLARFDMLAGNTAPAEERTRRVLRSAPENTEALFLLADIYNRTGRFPQAGETYEQLLPLTADRARALMGLARIQARTGDPLSALMNLEEAVSSAPDAMEPRLLLFNYYYGQGDFPNAEKVLAQAVEAHPETPALRILLGKYYFNRQRMAEAEAAFLEAVRLAPDQAGAYLVAGKFYSAVSKPETAVEMFRKAGRLNPQDVEVTTMLAEFYLDNKLIDDARRTIDGILEKHPAYFPARLLKVRSLLMAQHYDQAVALCDEYLKGNPAADQLLVSKGVAHAAKGDLAAAERVLAEAVAVAPANINAKFRLLDVYLKQDKVEQAQKLNQDMISFLHENFDVTVILGDTKLDREKAQKGLDSLDSLSRFASASPFDRLNTEQANNLKAEYDRLMSEFNRILENNPDRLNVFESIILLHAARKEYDVAQAKCDRQLERLKDKPLLAARVYNIKGGLHLARNSIDQAREAFDRAISLAPDFQKPYYGLARLYIINKDIDSAVRQYQSLLNRDPRQPVPYLLLGVMHKTKNDYPAAEGYYRKALEMDPHFVQAANNLAYLLAEQGRQLEEAVTLALRARELKPDDPYVLDTLGWVYYRQGKYDDAIRELRLSAEQLPDSADVNYHLGMAYYGKGDAVSARQYLEKAMQSAHPAAVEIRRILSELG